jgi:putative serine protease PepD
VQPGGPSAHAGLEVGDIITKIDGQAASSNAQIESLTLTRKAGDTVAIEYTRSGQTRNTTVTLAASSG